MDLRTVDVSRSRTPVQNEVIIKAGSFFESYARQFDEIYTIQNRKGLSGWLNRRLRASMLIRYEKTFSYLRPMDGRSVLDIGCGSGRYVLECLDLGAGRVTGIDLSKEMIGLTKKALENAGSPLHEVNLIVGDFIQHTFPEKFDYAVVMGVMDYIDDAAGFLAKLSRTVSCTAVLSFPVRESVWTLQRKARYKLRGCPLYFYSKRRIETLMRCSGFRSFLIERIRRDYFVVAEV